MKIQDISADLAGKVQVSDEYAEYLTTMFAYSIRNILKMKKTLKIEGVGRFYLSEITAPEEVRSKLRKKVTAIRFVPCDDIKQYCKKTKTQRIVEKVVPEKETCKTDKKPVKKAKK